MIIAKKEAEKIKLDEDVNLDVDGVLKYLDTAIYNLCQIKEYLEVNQIISQDNY